MDPSVGFTFTQTRHNDTYPLIDPLKVDLRGRNVLISGASKGIDRAIALSYARAGASGIAVLARSDLNSVASELAVAAKTAGRPEPQVLALKVDVTSLADVEAAAAPVEREFGGRLDVLVNNAGYLETFRPIGESDPDEWWRAFEVNVRGVYLMDRSFVPMLLRSGDGLKTAVVVSSVGAHLTTASSLSGIHPGGVETELASGMPESMHSLLTDKPELSGDTMVWLTKERREWLADRYVSVNWNMQELLDMKGNIVEKDLLKVKMRV